MIDEKDLFRLALYRAGNSLTMVCGQHKGLQDQRVECALQQGDLFASTILGRM